MNLPDPVAFFTIMAVISLANGVTAYVAVRNAVRSRSNLACAMAVRAEAVQLERKTLLTAIESNLSHHHVGQDSWALANALVIARAILQRKA